MEQEKLINYITGNLDENSASEVRHWINQSEENKKEFIRLKNLYALSYSASEPRFIEYEYNILRRKLRIGYKGKILTIAINSLKYAAVVALTILAVYFTQPSKPSGQYGDQQALFHQIMVPLGQISEFTFADGTQVWLNSGSTLRFPENPDKNMREMYLEGEAFFEVAENKNKPFKVHSGTQTVNVFGTSFNIRAYNDLKYIETTLVEGSLGISSDKHEGMIMLSPGEQFRYSTTEQKNILRKVDTQPYEAWKNGKLIFSNKSLGEIATDLERWYNVKISFDDDNIKEYRFSGTILKYKPIDQILEAIKLTSPIRFTIQVHPELSSEIMLYARK